MGAVAAQAEPAFWFGLTATELTAAATFGLLLATVALFVATFLLFRETARAVKTQRSDAKRLFVALHRPRLALVQMHVSQPKAEEPLQVRYWLINRGDTTATEIERCHGAIVVGRREPAGFPPYDRDGVVEKGLSGTIENGRRFKREAQCRALSADELDRVNRGEAYLIVFGYVSYKDENDTYWSSAFWRSFDPGTCQLTRVSDGDYDYAE